MRLLKRNLPFFLLALALSLPAVDAANAAEAGAQDATPRQEDQPRHSARQGQNSRENPYAARFQQLDTDKDGVVSRSEWPLAPESFNVVDSDKDGRLTRSELLVPNVGPRHRLGPSLQELEAQRQIRERDIRAQQQERSRIGVVPRGDVLNRLTPYEQSRLQRLDRNSDSRLSRHEWPGSRDIFNRLDRNRDGFVTLNEVRR
jgi:Ca2+-binding EF-hand superfamily protein